MFFPLRMAWREAVSCKALAISWAILRTKCKKSMTQLQFQLLHQGPEAMWIKKMPCQIREGWQTKGVS